MVSPSTAISSASVKASVAAWRRFDVMAYCLAQVGRYEGAAQYYEKVLAAHPTPTTEANLRRCRQAAMGRGATSPVPVGKGPA